MMKSIACNQHNFSDQTYPNPRHPHADHSIFNVPNCKKNILQSYKNISPHTHTLKSASVSNKSPLVEVGDEVSGPLNIGQELGVVLPLPHVLPLQDRDAGDLAQQEGYKDGRNHAKQLPALESGRSRHEEPTPQHDLPKVVRVADDAPETVTDPLVVVGRVTAESELLIVSQALDEHACQPQSPADVVPGTEFLVFFLGVEEESGEQSQQYP